MQPVRPEKGDDTALARLADAEAEDDEEAEAEAEAAAVCSAVAGAGASSAPLVPCTMLPLERRTSAGDEVDSHRSNT